MTPAEFRKELVKIMPGYNWTIHKERFKTSDPPTYFCATGIQSAGFNRLSTLQVERCEKNGDILYEVKSSGFGKRAPWLHTAKDKTLARALRELQDHYEYMSRLYGGHASDLQFGRKNKIQGGTE